MRDITVAELRVGMVVHHKGKRIPVESIEDGGSCKGLHLNVVRKPPFVKNKKGKYVPNPEGGAIVYSDGCWQPCTTVTVDDEQMTRVEDALSIA